MSVDLAAAFLLEGRRSSIGVYSNDFMSINGTVPEAELYELGCDIHLLQYYGCSLPFSSEIILNRFYDSCLYQKNHENSVAERDGKVLCQFPAGISDLFMVRL